MATISTEEFLAGLLKNNDDLIAQIEPLHQKWFDQVVVLYEDKGKDIVPILRSATVTYALDDLKKKMFEMQVVLVLKFLEPKTPT